MTLLSLSGTSIDILILGVTLLVGFGADWLGYRFRVPDVLWLIALGILVGPLFGILSRGQFLLLAPVLGVATLVLILFDAGLDLRLGLIRPLATPAILFAVASYLSSTTLAFLAGYLWLFPHEVALALIFGTALGCTSGAVIIPVATRLGLPPELRSIVQLESAIEDALAVIAVSLILTMLAPSAPSFVLNLTAAILLPLPVGIAVGLAAGLVWIFFLYSWQDRPFSALATLGFVFVVYAGAQELGGSGILAALVFGGVLANESTIRRRLGRVKPFVLSAELRKVEVEIAFLLRAYFLFLIGLFVSLANPGLLFTVVLVALVLLLFAARRGLAQLSAQSATLPASWGTPLAALYGRGLTSAVLLVLALEKLPTAEQLFLPALLVIVATNIVMTAGLSASPPAERGAPETERRWEGISQELVTFGLEGRPGPPPRTPGEADAPTAPHASGAERPPHPSPNADPRRRPKGR